MGILTLTNYTGQLDLPQRRHLRYVGSELSAFALNNYHRGSLGLEPILGNDELATLLGLESHHLGRTIRAYAEDIGLARERERFLRARNIDKIRAGMSDEQVVARIRQVTDAAAGRTLEERQEIGRSLVRAVCAVYTDGKCNYDSQIEALVGVTLERFVPDFKLVPRQNQQVPLGDITLDFLVEVAWQRFYVEVHTFNLSTDLFNGQEWYSDDEKTRYKSALGKYEGADLERFVRRVEALHLRRYHARRQTVVDVYDPGARVIVVRTLDELYSFLKTEVTGELPDQKTFGKVCLAMKGRIREVEK